MSAMWSPCRRSVCQTTRGCVGAMGADLALRNPLAMESTFSIQKKG